MQELTFLRGELGVSGEGYDSRKQPRSDHNGVRLCMHKHGHAENIAN